MTDLYVYYKLRSGDAAALAPRVRAMQAQLGAACQLKQRPEARDGLLTWMEVYPSVPGGFDARLEQAALNAGLAAFIQGPRRLEIFTDLTPCA
ncbi:DUF4936 family protein [Massilia yuzhufengensis]|uniref:DUF4936 domain-containing protein n=1 Tax=Massilia yuzhufengensis TaxID=1164594 RepID=A0A1I1S2B1_9BURK|nr:DUF4936 family protein [Massilia yuzhufengensis]SFD40734.1 protein of unknown function [Massilia yuzhufengensis]